ncbi:hypothetical protein GCM10017744_102190 [Streptomyces antimycoticus]|uniref:Uncharacterized protein n=1 Tax=Streptomyces antimycoticus TaxID=68175 RepID=A0A4D4KL54_9ACTN|nr:hypothetical protein [Streptomyces antimycoticus]GDY49252.1 hypothetical protein SANT12839_101340 [Streptomyces antimycoticus]
MTPAALSWAVAAGAPAENVRIDWQAGRATEIPIGSLWHVLRVTGTTGRDALARLQERGEPLGPVLEVPLRFAVEFLVPRCAAASWPPLVGTRWVEHGIIRCPGPERTRSAGQRAACGRRWIVPPGPAAAAATDADALCEAVAAAVVHQAERWICTVRSSHPLV